MKETPPMLKVIENEVESENEFRTQLDALVREGARRMLMLAVKAEADEYVERFAEVRDERRGRAQAGRPQREGQEAHGHDRRQPAGRRGPG